jgi:predicted Zn-dependent peptidase
MKLVTALAAVLALAFPVAAQVKLPPYTRQVLPNGVVVVMMPRADLPLLTLRAVLRGGAESDPPQLAGLSSVTAELLRRGSAGRTAGEFSEALDFLGATWQASSDDQSTEVGMEFLSKDLDRALGLFADALLRPAFPEAEVRKVLAQRIDSSRAAKDNPAGAIGLYFRPFFYGASHPYGRAAGGDEISLARIGRGDILDYHRRMYAGRNLILIAVGQFEAGALAPRLAQAFSAAPAGEAYAWAPDVAPQRGSSARLLLVDKPDATQTYFQIGQPGIRRASPDRIPLLLVNTLFGGRFTSMLNDALRVTSGLTYGANCRLEQSRLAGGIVISTYTRTEATEKAIDMALDQLKRLGAQGVTAEQLASAKAYVKGLYPTQRLETADQLAETLKDLEVFGLGRDEVDKLFERIDAVTLETANIAARRYYQTSGLTFVLVGNAGKIRAAAGKYAPEMREIAITAPGFSVP